ncbi:MAG: cytochrome c-type biogenesis protein CcmH [Gammaproteobacteria bacterium]
MTSVWRGALLLVSAMLFMLPSVHAIDIETLEDPALRERYDVITFELRCLVCQNQTIADSNAELAVDLRNQVREMLLAGKTDNEIRDYMTARYGDFVLYRPPLRRRTIALWFGPIVALLFGFVVLWRVVRQHKGGDASVPENDVA